MTPPPAPALPGQSPQAPLPNNPGEATSYYDAYPVMARTGQPASGRRTVCFWNLANRDVQIAVGEVRTTLPRSKRWTVELPVSFRWQLVGQAERQEVIREGEAGLEIVIRQ